MFLVKKRVGKVKKKKKKVLGCRLLGASLPRLTLLLFEVLFSLKAQVFFDSLFTKGLCSFILDFWRRKSTALDIF